MLLPIRPKRIWYHYPYVMPNTVLSPEPVDELDGSSLRAEASTNGKCYVRFIRPLHDGTYLARVAATPEDILSHGYTLVLTTAQLTLARPYDCRTMDKAA